jgi:hypothetical protein
MQTPFARRCVRARFAFCLLVVVVVPLSCDDSADEASTGTQVSFEVYERAVFAYRDCMETAGYGIELRQSQRSSELYEYIVPGPATSDGTDDRCYVTNLNTIDGEWQRDVFRRNPELDESRQGLVRCAEAFGLVVPAGITIDEVYDLIIASGRDVTECPTG